MISLFQTLLHLHMYDVYRIHYIYISYIRPHQKVYSKKQVFIVHVALERMYSLNFKCT